MSFFIALDDAAFFRFLHETALSLQAFLYVDYGFIMIIESGWKQEGFTELMALFYLVVFQINAFKKKSVVFTPRYIFRRKEGET